MKVNVEISSKILDWVIRRVQADTLPNKTIELLNSWSKGEKTPTFNQVEDVSRSTGIPLGYFFLKTPPIEDLSIVEYRTVDSIELNNPSRNLIDTLHYMDQIQEWTRKHLLSEGASVATFVGSLKYETSVEIFAQKVRDLLGLELEWYRNINKVEDAFKLIRFEISNLGTIVMMSGIVGNNTNRRLDIKEFRAFSIVDEYAPLIFINSNDSKGGNLFSLLHEFAHICIGANSLFNDRYSTERKVSKLESLCNAVTAEILVPNVVFKQEWDREIKVGNIDTAICNLTKKFRCGMTVIARRAYDNAFIDFCTYKIIAQKAVVLYNESRKHSNKGGDFYRTTANRLDKNFFNMLVSSVNEGKTLYSDAFRLTNTNRNTFSNLVSDVRGGRK